jgi:hypothetical protein
MKVELVIFCFWFELEVLDRIGAEAAGFDGSSKPNAFAV